MLYKNIITYSMKKNAWLLEHKKNITSQFGEDGIIEKIFELIPGEKRWGVEFGAWNGIKSSNTRNLIMNGWHGIMIEALRTRFKELKNNYYYNDNVICLNKFIDFEGKNSLDNILSSTIIPINFDLLSIDIDGNDYYIWESLKKYKPKVVIIEHNPSIPNDIEFIQEKNININQGNSLLSLTNLAKSKKYELICITKGNAIFVKQEYYTLFNIENNSLDQLNQETSEFQMKLFQLYDGTLMLKGCDKLIWKNQKISQEMIQALPKKLRTFSDSTTVNNSLNIVTKKWIKLLINKKMIKNIFKKFIRLTFLYDLVL
jgi:hypothetical protein